jgi:hypothetical protein
MIPFILAYLWHGLLGWVGITGVVLIGAVAVFVYVPINAVRHACVGVATVCVVILFLYPKAFFDGERHVQAQWQAAEQAARKLGDAARADALGDAARGVRDPFDSDDN